MNVSNSVQNLIFEGVKAIFTDDDVNTNKVIREMNYYIAGRVYRSNLIVGDTFPQATMNINELSDDSSLPSSVYMLNLRFWTKMGESVSQFNLANMISRAIYLLNKKPETLNSFVTSGLLRCRFILKQSVIDANDDVAKLYSKLLLFKLICDDEILNQ